jgi:hypothetical protein
VRAIEAGAGVKLIGNYACSGTTVLEELGAEHLCTRHPILYTSADSVMQIAAHENVLPIPRLYEVCEIARRHCDSWRIGRVIARPFDGKAGNFPADAETARFLHDAAANGSQRIDRSWPNRDCCWQDQRHLLPEAELANAIRRFRTAKACARSISSGKEDVTD